MKKNLYCLVCLFPVLLGQCTTEKLPQPVLGTRSVPILDQENYQFRDLNKNGALDPYEDWRLPVGERVANLVGLMSLEEKVGLMFHPNIAVPADGILKYDLSREEKALLEGQKEEAYQGPIGPGGQQPAGGGMMMGQMRRSATAKEYIEEKNFRCILNNGVAEPRLFANWSNGMQEIAEKSRLGIPIMFSTDPRHGASLGAHVRGKQYFSQWPSREGQFGIAASRDPEVVKNFGRVTAEEYRAVGLHMILGPQIDVTTEPRWGRNAGCFSESAELTAEMLEAYMDGAQGESVGPGKILVHLKHWPGSGPHDDGAGRWLVYPGNNFEYHLIPWKAGIRKGALAAMGYYSGTYFDTLGVNYSHFISTEVLYQRLGFKGAICTDWGVIGRTGALRPDLTDLSMKEKYLMSIQAGVDQFGSETDPETVVALVREGSIPEERIDLAASHILQWHFLLGLFENPYVDSDAAALIVQSEENQALGFDAQLKSVILLENDGILPLDTTRLSLYVSGVDSLAASSYATLVSDPALADVALLRVSTAAPRGFGTSASSEVNIDFPAETLETIRKVAGTGVPVVVVLNLSGSLVVLPRELLEQCSGLFMVFDVLDEALLQVVFGAFNPVGKLPFELPSSMEAVRKQLEDVPFDSENPLYEYGYGLSY